MPSLVDPSGALEVSTRRCDSRKRRDPGAVTRIVHYGDSPTTADLITGDVRQLLQRHFGDAGHGFSLVAKPWAWYGHRGVDCSGSGWTIAAATHARQTMAFRSGRRQFPGAAGASPHLVLARRSRRAWKSTICGSPAAAALPSKPTARNIGQVDHRWADEHCRIRTLSHCRPGTREIDLEVDTRSRPLVRRQFSKRTAPGMSTIAWG